MELPPRTPHRIEVEFASYCTAFWQIGLNTLRRTHYVRVTYSEAYEALPRERP
jgi:hypothetical protein